MKFIHLSDICIGNPIESGRRWDKDRSTELLDSLRNLLAKAEEDGVDLVMITGGLFAHIPAIEELESVNDLFRAHSGIYIVIIAGKTDIVAGSSPVKSFEWSSNVRYVLEPSVQRIVLDKIGTEIFAASCCSVLEAEVNTIKEKPPILPFRDLQEGEGEETETVLVERLKNAEPKKFSEAAEAYPDSEEIRIAMLCPDDESEAERAFTGSEFSYVALGGKSSQKEIIKDMAYCPGAFEPEDSRDTGEHGAMEGEIFEETGRLEHIEFMPLAGLSYVTLNIKISPKTTAEELISSVRKELIKRGEKNIYRLRLTGSRAPEEDLKLDSIKSAFRINEIIDETVPEYDYVELFREHPQDMIGFYISSIVNRKKEMSQIEKKAMFYGLEALLKTSDNED